MGSNIQFFLLFFNVPKSRCFSKTVKILHILDNKFSKLNFGLFEKHNFQITILILNVNLGFQALKV